MALVFVLVCVLVIRPLLHHFHHYVVVKKEEDNRNFVVLLFLVALLISFTAEVIGIHAFFGAFLAGIIMPRGGEFIRSVVPKIELLIVEFFLPLYFANSGLNTNIGSLNTGYLWGSTIAIILIASAVKFVPATLCTKWLSGQDWRFSVTLGVLMNTRGLVELIALNIGLSMGILTQRLFTMLVLMALFTTIATPPLVYVLYQKMYQQNLQLQPAPRRLTVASAAQPEGLDGENGVGSVPVEPSALLQQVALSMPAPLVGDNADMRPVIM